MSHLGFQRGTKIYGKRIIVKTFESEFGEPRRKGQLKKAILFNCMGSCPDIAKWLEMHGNNARPMDCVRSQKAL